MMTLTAHEPLTWTRQLAAEIHGHLERGPLPKHLVLDRMHQRWDGVRGDEVFEQAARLSGIIEFVDQRGRDTWMVPVMHEMVQPVPVETVDDASQDASGDTPADEPEPSDDESDQPEAVHPPPPTDPIDRLLWELLSSGPKPGGLLKGEVRKGFAVSDRTVRRHLLKLASFTRSGYPARSFWTLKADS